MRCMYRPPRSVRAADDALAVANGASPANNSEKCPNAPAVGCLIAEAAVAATAAARYAS